MNVIQYATQSELRFRSHEINRFTRIIDIRRSGYLSHSVYRRELTMNVELVIFNFVTIVGKKKLIRKTQRKWFENSKNQLIRSLMVTGINSLQWKDLIDRNSKTLYKSESLIPVTNYGTL